jgi:hypothetical protein
MESRNALVSIPSNQYAEPIGLVGIVTGRVAPKKTGEVMLSIRGGVEAFYAHPYDKKEKMPVGTEVVVVDYKAPRTVYVTRLNI